MLRAITFAHPSTTTYRQKQRVSTGDVVVLAYHPAKNQRRLKSNTQAPYLRFGQHMRYLHDPSLGDIPFDNSVPHENLLRQLIDTSEVQRLRRVRQLGLGTNYYNAANHTRFEHSVGVSTLARKVMDHIEQALGIPVEPVRKMAFLAAALLHDLGHGPYSHTFEHALGKTQKNHEEWTQKIILDPGTQVNQVLRNFDHQTMPDLPERVAELLREDSKDPLSHLIHGQLNIDSLDYTLRDSRFTGYAIGKIDLPKIEHIISHMATKDQKTIYFRQAAVKVLEEVLQVRLNVYRHIFFLPKKIASETMLKLIFDRYIEVLKDLEAPGSKLPLQLRAELSKIPEPVQKIFSGKPISIQEYLWLDDGTITEFLKVCRSCSDPILKRLGEGILDRKLYKYVDITALKPEQVSQLEVALKPLIDAKEVVIDRRGIPPYKMPHILIETREDKLVPFVEVSEWVKSQKPFSMVGIVFRNHQDKNAPGIIKKAVQDALNKIFAASGQSCPIQLCDNGH